MKKILSLILALLLAFSMLTACSSEETALTTRPPENEAEPEAGSSLEVVETEAPAPATAINEIVIYDENNIKITATGLDFGTMFGAEVKFLLENNTDKNIALSGDYFAVNGITLYGSLYIEAAAGKKANGALTIFTDDLQRAQITDLATISSGTAYIFDTDSYETLYQVPFALETTANSTYTQPIDESGELLFEQNGVTIIAQTMSDSLTGKTVQLFVKNETGKDINISGENISVNGFTLDAWLYDTIYKDTVSYCLLELYSTSLEENNIETVEEITFTVSIIDPVSYSTLNTSGELQIFVAE